MAGTGGFFLQGLGSGLQSGFEMGWNIKEKKKLEDQKKKLEESVNKLMMNNPDVFQSSTATPDQISKVNAEALAMGTEVYEHITNYTKAITNNNITEANKENKYLSDLTDLIDNYGPINLDDPIFANFVKGDGRKYLEAYNSMAVKEKEAVQAQPQIERFASPTDVTAKYPDATPKHTTQGWIPEFAADKVGTPLSAKDNWAINSSLLPEGDPRKISIAQRNKYFGVYIAPEKATALEDKITKAKQYGATNEEIKKMIVGGPGADTTLTPTPQSVEGIREDILDAENIEDARRISKNHIAKYGDTSGIADVDKYWTDGKVSDLDNLVAVLNDITAGTPDSRNIKGNKMFSYDIDGKVTEQTGAEWYAAVYESYTALIKELEKQGIDVSQYKKLKPLSEIKKIKVGAFVGGGVETGDLIKIYY